MNHRQQRLPVCRCLPGPCNPQEPLLQALQEYNGVATVDMVPAVEKQQSMNS